MLFGGTFAVIMLRVILWILLGYFLFRFVFNFLVPVFRAARQMRRQVKDFQQHMNDAQTRQQQFQQNAAGPGQRTTTPATEKAGDYIDFEEIK